jgi:hypothetical protein
VDYLAQNMDEDFLQEILSNFKTDPTPCKGGSDSAAPNIDAALESITDLVTILFSVTAAMELSIAGHAVAPNPKTSAFIDQCLGMVLEKWGEVIRWIKFFVYLTPQPELSDDYTWDKVANSCVQVIEAAITNADQHLCKSQIVALPSTIDCIIRFLCLRNPHTGRPSRLRKPEATCLISTLFLAAGLSDIGHASLSLRLASLNASASTVLVDAIVERLQDVLPQTISPGSISLAAQELVQVFTPLLTVPSKQLERGILTQGVRTLAQVVDGAIRIGSRDALVWASISTSISHLIQLSSPRSGKAYRRIVEEIFEDGIIRSMLQSLPYTNPASDYNLHRTAQAVYSG